VSLFPLINARCVTTTSVAFSFFPFPRLKNLLDAATMSNNTVILISAPSVLNKEDLNFYCEVWMNMHSP